MSYFLHELSANNYSLPWTFILLLTVSLLTLASLTWTILLHTRHGLSPVLNTVLNTLLALLWSLSFALLAWWSASTLTSACALREWESDTGASVCRTYKALFSFALLGTVGTLCALGLDVWVLKGAEGRGRFVSLKMGTKQRGDGEGDVDHGIWDSSPLPAAMGYAVPEGQFGYADVDTGYAGAGAQMGRRSVEGRL